jgi:hypothetical protein
MTASSTSVSNSLTRSSASRRQPSSPPPQRSSDGAFHDHAARDPLGYWADRARELDWEEPFTEVLDESNPPFYEWLPTASATRPTTALTATSRRAPYERVESCTAKAAEQLVAGSKANEEIWPDIAAWLGERSDR